MWEIRAIREDEADLFRARLSRAFGADLDDDDGSRERFLELFELDRTVAAFDRGDIIGTGGALSFDLTVPGGAVVPMAGTTVVTVQPTHRRRGVLREMMSYHLEEVAAHGEPLAGLWASESSIYGRFGYGPATYLHEMKLETASVAMRDPEPEGRVRLIDQDEAGPVLRSVYERIRPDVAGMLTRSDAWWAHRRMRDDESVRDGKSARRYAVYEKNGSTLGYATYRQNREWSESAPEGEVLVSEVITATPEAHRALWGFLSNIDLFTKLEWWNAPIDDPLPFEITDPRRVRRRLLDALWIRLMDLPRSLEARSYEEDGSLTLEVEDGFLPDASGTYRLEVSDGEASCVPSDSPADISCETDVLGHLYLGGGDALGMARAGRIRGEPDAVRALHRMFRTDRAPWCPEVF